MKKLIRTAGFLFAALALTACDEDYTDWANPQPNPQENPAEAVSAVVQALPTAAIDRDQAPDTVAIASLPTLVNVPQASVAKVHKVFLNGFTYNPAKLLISVHKVYCKQVFGH